MPQLQRVSPGDDVTAAGHNALVEAIRDIAGGVGGGVGAPLMQAMLAAVLAALDPERWAVCKVWDVRIDLTRGPAGQTAPVAGGSGSPAYWPSQVSYHVLGVGRSGIDRDEMVPFYGREVEGDEARIYPAKKHMTCLIERDIDAEGTAVARLYLLPGSERVARRKCGG